MFGFLELVIKSNLYQQSDLNQAKDEVDRLQQRLNALASLDCKDAVVSLKRELASLRGKVSCYLKWFS